MSPYGNPSLVIIRLCWLVTIFEFDKLVRGIYTLRYLRNPQLERNVHRSQNRIESYHQLRSAIAPVGGKKELTGRTDIGSVAAHPSERALHSPE
jgi:Tn3 transposase DDE domain